MRKIMFHKRWLSACLTAMIVCTAAHLPVKEVQADIVLHNPIVEEKTNIRN